MSAAQAWYSAFPGTSTDKVVARFRLLGIAAVTTETPSRLGDFIATGPPCEDEMADFSQPPWPEGVPPSDRAQRVRHLSATKQRRLDFLMDKNNEGQLDEAEQQEFQALVCEVEQLTIDNARRLVERM